MTLDEAYEPGKKAKRTSAFRVSPVYDDSIRGLDVVATVMLDQYWFAGYDGIPKPEGKKP